MDVNQSPQEAAQIFLDMGWNPVLRKSPQHEWGAQCFNTPDDGPAFGIPPEEFDQEATAAGLEAGFRRAPTANVGITMGWLSGIMALDVLAPAGVAKFQELCGGVFPPTLAFSTPGGGYCVLYEMLESELLIRGRCIRDASGKEALNVITDEGVVVAPPSVHVSGERYTWLKDHGPSEIWVAKVPDWLLKPKPAVLVPIAQPVVEQSLKQKAEKILQDLLLEGPKSAKECMEAAARRKIGASSVREARLALGIVTIRVGTVGKSPIYHWALPKTSGSTSGTQALPGLLI